MILPNLLDYVLRGFAVTATGLLALVLCYRISASRRHLIAGFTLLAVTLLPSLAFLQRLAPISIRVPAPPASVAKLAAPQEPLTAGPQTDFETIPSQAPPTFVSPGIDVESLAWWLVIGVSLVLMARVALSATALRSMRANLENRAFAAEAESAAREIGLRTIPEVGISKGVKVPIALACVRSLVVLPEEARDWTVERRRSVLLHEFAHVKRQDGAWQAIAEIACAFQWWNPFAWMLRRSLRLEAERAADDMVLLAGVRPAEYAADLVTIAKSIQKPVTAILVSPMARRTQIQDRVKAILMKEKNRQTAGKAGLLAVSATALLATGAIAAVKLSQETGLPTSTPPLAANAAAQANGTPGTKNNGWTATGNDGSTQQIVSVVQEIGSRKFAWKPDGTTIPAEKSLMKQFSFGRNAGPFILVTKLPEDPNSNMTVVVSDGSAKTGELTVDGKSYYLVSPSDNAPKDRFSFTINVFKGDRSHVSIDFAFVDVALHPKGPWPPAQQVGVQTVDTSGVSVAHATRASGSSAGSTQHASQGTAASGSHNTVAAGGQTSPGGGAAAGVGPSNGIVVMGGGNTAPAGQSVAASGMPANGVSPGQGPGIASGGAAAGGAPGAGVAVGSGQNVATAGPGIGQPAGATGGIATAGPIIGNTQRGRATQVRATGAQARNAAGIGRGRVSRTRTAHRATHTRVTHNRVSRGRHVSSTARGTGSSTARGGSSVSGTAPAGAGSTGGTAPAGAGNTSGTVSTSGH